jgi:endogenous inhibitor of DNA gyrase (YacG/DUF329 family)
MGEIAEMMLDGTMCEGCGEFMDDIIAGDDAPGFPRYCSARCARDRGASPELVKAGKEWSRPTEKCPHCGKHLNPGGTAQHVAAKHPDKPVQP